MIDRKHLFRVLRLLPTDYTDYGGSVVRWEKEDESYSDCSCGCKWALWLDKPFQSDWCVCTKTGAPRCGLLTFEHMTGKDCFEPKQDATDRMTI